jgi:hypothetical protein
MLYALGGEEGAMLTAIIALFTRSFFINPSLERFSISSLFEDPEQYHAIVFRILVVNFAAGRMFFGGLSMQLAVET